MTKRQIFRQRIDSRLESRRTLSDLVARTDGVQDVALHHLEIGDDLSEVDDDDESEHDAHGAAGDRADRNRLRALERLAGDAGVDGRQSCARRKADILDNELV